jgi:hypothetical protein
MNSLFIVLNIKIKRFLIIFINFLKLIPINYLSLIKVFNNFIFRSIKPTKYKGIFIVKTRFQIKLTVSHVNMGNNLD